MKKILYAFIAVAMFCAAVVAAVVFFLDDAKVRPYIEDFVKQKTGRSLIVNGEFDIQPGFITKVVMKDVNISNPEGAVDPYIVSADTLEVSVPLFPILKKELVIKNFALNGVALNLYTDKDGKNNWTFTDSEKLPAPQEGTDDSADKSEKTQKEIPFIKEVILEKVEIQNVGFSYVDEQTTQMYQLFLKNLSLTDSEERMQLAATAQILNQDITINADLDSMSDLLSDQEEFDFSFIIEGFKTSVELKGKVQDIFNVGKISASLTAKTNRLQQVGALFGLHLPALNDLNASVTFAGTFKSLKIPDFMISVGSQQSVLLTLQGDVGNVYPLQNADVAFALHGANPAVLATHGVTIAPFVLKADLLISENYFAAKNIAFNGGESDFKGNVSIDATEKVLVNAVFDSEKISLNKLFLSIPVKQKDFSVPVQTAFVDSNASKTVFSKEELPFDLLNRIDAVVKVDIKKFLAANGTDLNSVVFSAVMKDGVLQVPTFNLANMLTMKADLNAAQKPASMNFSVVADNLSLPVLFLQSGVTTGTAKINISLSSTGNSEHQMVKNLNGDVFVFVQDTQLQNTFLSGLKTILPPSSTYENRKELMADCIVVNVPIVNGMIFSDQQVALQSGDFDVQINGEVNLGEEKLGLNVITGVTTQNALNTISGTLSVTGALTSPQIGFDAENIMSKALSAGMAYLFSGKNAAEEYLSSPVPKNACKIAVAGGADAFQKQAVRIARPATKKKRKKRSNR